MVGPAVGFVLPGTCRTTGVNPGAIASCYGERSVKSNDLLESEVVIAAPEITIAIQETDALFISEPYGTWKPVK